MRGRLARTALPLLGLTVGMVLLSASPASAHPLGNFSVNAADRLVVVAGGLDLTHVVDLAEIPTLQLAQAAAGVDLDGDTELQPAELQAYAGRECDRLAGVLQLTVDGQPAPLTVEGSTGALRPGQAGLMTTRLECRLASDRRPVDSVSFQDPTPLVRVGWREVTAASVCGRLTASDVPSTSLSGLLTSYPEDLLSSPLRVASASFGIEAGGPCLAAEGAGPAGEVTSVLPRGVDRLTSAYTAFVGRVELTLPVALLAVLLSVLLGAGHAVAPGHGKTVIAAYLVGQRGTRTQAVWLGATVTATHTAGVLLLGALLTAGRLTAPERVVPVTELLSGLLLAGTGAYLLLVAVRRRRAGLSLMPALPGSDHGHAEHDHGHPHEHPHEHVHDAVPEHRAAVPGPAGTTAVIAPPVAHSHGGRSHTHAPLDDAPLGWRSLAAMGVAGGLVPSPSALVVLLGAAGLGRPGFGALLVLGYGVGMALTLTAAGLLVLRGQALLERRGWGGMRGTRVVALLPLLTAGAVIVVGVGLMVRAALTGLG